MVLKPGEALVLVVRRNEKEPFDHLVTVRISESSFEKGSNDLRLDGAQLTAFAMENDSDYATNLEKAIAVVRSLQSN